MSVRRGRSLSEWGDATEGWAVRDVFDNGSGFRAFMSLRRRRSRLRGHHVAAAERGECSLELFQADDVAAIKAVSDFFGG